MSYSVNTPCGNCIKKKNGCIDGIVVTGAVQGIIHAYAGWGNAHQGAGNVTLECCNKQEPEPESQN